MITLLLGWVREKAPALTMCDACRCRLLPGADSYALVNSHTQRWLQIRNEGLVQGFDFYRDTQGRRCADCGAPDGIAVAVEPERVSP